MFPRLNIDLEKLSHNATTLVSLCQKNAISAAAVTKVFCADSRMIEVLRDVPFGCMADSRLENIERYPENLKQRKMLLRLPMPSEAERVVNAADLSLNSEMYTINLLGEAATKAGKTHGIVLMIDLGDLREGIYHTEKELIHATVQTILSHKSLDFEGLGVNLTCYGSVLPSPENLQNLVDAAKLIEDSFGVRVKTLCGGNSSSLSLLIDGKIPKEVNNLRLGESIIRGVETAYGSPFANLKQDVISLEAEIIEVMEKPSLPEGETGFNAFGERITYLDEGIRLRAILAVGRQDTSISGLTSVLPGINVVGGSSDHLIVDITHAVLPLNVGDSLVFNLSYGAILAGFTSPYVKRNYT